MYIPPKFDIPYTTPPYCDIDSAFKNDKPVTLYDNILRKNTIAKNATIRGSMCFFTDFLHITFRIYTNINGNTHIMTKILSVEIKPYPKNRTVKRARTFFFLPVLLFSNSININTNKEKMIANT